MRARSALIICVLVAIAALCPASGYSQHAVAVSPNPCDSASLHDGFDPFVSVFAVTVQHGQLWERKGTATLIDKSGIFVTAAHVVRYYKERPISLEQKFASRIPVEVISPSDTPDDYDFV